jgi:hypothetical protein
MNALKDGTYAESAVLPGESREDYDRHVQLLHTRLGVIDGPEEFFSASGADAAWKHQRCLRAAESVEQRQRTEARRRQTPDAEQELRKAALIADNLHKQPLETVIRLCESPAGCDWIRNQWKVLYDNTYDDDCLFNSQRIRACWLLGKRPRELFDDPSVWEFTRIFLGSLLSIRPELKSEIINVFLKEVPAEEHGYYGSEFEYRFNHMLRCKLPKTCAEAAALQRDFISKEMAKLEARAARLREQRAEDAGFDAAEAPLESSVEGARRDRRIASLFRRAERGVLNARTLRNERRREEQSDDPSSESSGDKASGVDGGATPEEAMTPEPPRAETPTPSAGGQPRTETSERPTDTSAQEAPPAAQHDCETQSSQPATGNSHHEPLPTTPGASPTENSQRTPDISLQAPPAADDVRGHAGTAAPEHRNGLGGGILPALVLLVLVPLLGGTRRERASQPQGRGPSAPAVAMSSEGSTAPPAVANRPVRRVGRASIDRADPHRQRRGSRWALRRSAALEPKHRSPVRRGSPDPAVGATVRSPRTASAAGGRPTVLGPAGSETRAERDRVATHRMGWGERWPRPGASGFEPPDCAKTARQNDPKLDASREPSGQSSFGLAPAVTMGLRPRDSPGLRGPPP